MNFQKNENTVEISTQNTKNSNRRSKYHRESKTVHESDLKKNSNIYSTIAEKIEKSKSPTVTSCN